MGRRPAPKIITKSYVHYKGELVEFQNLPPEVLERAKRELAVRYFNALFAGKATFFYPEDEQAAQEGAEKGA